MGLLGLLQLPEARQLDDLDDPASVDVHAKIIQRKPFLRRLYLEWYATLRDAIDGDKDRVVVELGSGGGFIKDIIPDALTSDVMDVPITTIETRIARARRMLRQELDRLDCEDEARAAARTGRARGEIEERQ